MDNQNPTPEPLKSKTMTLSQLQLRVLDVLRRVRFQLHRQAHEDGMSDTEFLEEFIGPLETEIYQDRQVAKMYRQAKREGGGKGVSK